MVSVTLTVNGEKRSATVVPETTLLKLLRESFNLTGAKLGCDVVLERSVQYTTTQYETICRDMQNKVVDAIWIITDPASAIKLMNGCQNIGYPKGRFLGQHGIYLDLTLSQAGPYSDGLIANSGLLPDTEVTPATIRPQSWPSTSTGTPTIEPRTDARAFRPITPVASA